MDLSVNIENIKFNYRSGLLINRGNRILVEVNPEIDFVTIPGGRIKTLESSISGLQREIKEEMCIDILEDEVIMKCLIENFFEYDNTPFHELYILYKINVEDNDSRFTDNMINHDSKNHYYKWIDKSSFKEVNLLPKQIKYLKDDDTFEHIIVNDLK